jgi:hypothetical protein
VAGSSGADVAGSSGADVAGSAGADVDASVPIQKIVAACDVLIFWYAMIFCNNFTR